MITLLHFARWPLAAAALLALLAAAPVSAGNRYDERKVDAKYEPRGDVDENAPAAEEPPAREENAPAENSGDSTAAATEPSPAAEPVVEAEPAQPLPPLPAASHVSVVLSRGGEDGPRAPKAGVPEFDVNVPTLLATVTIAGDAAQGLAARMVAEAVEGTPAGEEVIRSYGEEEVSGEQRTVSLRFELPEGGLAPGRYRVEVQENAPPRRTITSVPFTTVLGPLPAEARLRVGVHESEAAPETLACGEVSSRPDRLFATLETLDPTSLAVGARLVADEVEGLSRGRAVADNGGFRLDLLPDTTRVTAEFALPRLGLPVGRYRVEFLEASPPHRVVKSATFTTRERIEEAHFDLADPEFGGLLESATAEGGAGLTWAWTTLRPANRKIWQSSEHGAPAALPSELVVSFFKREMAMVSAVEIESEGDVAGYRKVEVWGSLVSPKDGFQKVAEKEFPSGGNDAYVVPVPSSLMRYLKLRFVSNYEGYDAAVVKTVRVIEAQAPGYQPLRQRFPEIRDWRLQPKHAAQQGLFFLQSSGVEFQRFNKCMGCHVQSQALMGLSVAQKNDYVVSAAAERELAGFTVSCARPAGDIKRNPEETAGDGETTNTIFSALGLAYAHPTPEAEASLKAAAGWLAARQDPEGLVVPDTVHEPVTQGEILQTANAMEIWAAALAAGGEPAFKQNLARALAWMVAAPMQTTQDMVFKVLTFMRHGGVAEKKLARQLCQQLLAEQGSDGAWRIDPEVPLGPPSPFATGQVLYALRQAGFSPNAPSFRRGVQWLLVEQKPDASWRGADTQSSFASTMWPVIALTGSFSSKAEPAHLNVTALPRPVPPAPPPAPPVVVAAKGTLPKNILLVFDCSFSMTEKIRKRAKFEIAKEVLHEVIGKLPDDTKVGLRLYGHRHGSMTSESRTDTQLVVPIGPLDRAKLLRTIDAAQAQGQTPMVLSTLQAGEDLKKVGGGILIVVTDGEESCGGRPRKAGPQLAELGVPLRLDVVGFALTGRRVVDEMTAFTAPTGGHFYTAADGLQLAAALQSAVSPAPVAAPPPPPPLPAPEPEDFAYEVFDAKGVSVARSSTLSGEPPELAPGVFRIELRDGAKTAKLDNLKLAESQTLELRYDPVTGRIEYMP